jgi:hypothetical protein
MAWVAILFPSALSISIHFYRVIDYSWAICPQSNFCFVALLLWLFLSPSNWDVHELLLSIEYSNRGTTMLKRQYIRIT